MGLAQALAVSLMERRGTLFPFVPVFLGCGIGLYFGLGQEPGVAWLVAAATGAVLLAASLRWWAEPAAPLIWALALVAAGTALAGARAHQVAGPVIEGRYYGPVQGRIVGLDRSASDALRLTLDRVVLRDRAPAATPRRVRVALHGDQALSVTDPGAVVLLTAHLARPSGPAEPGGFDFRRHAWFQGLGAVGYTRTPVLEWRQAGPRAALVFRARMALSERIRATLPGERGAFAAAVLTGDRSAMTQDTLRALRQSNLAHLLAISGLHMGLLAGFVFAFLRLAIAAVPPLALRVPGRKIAAGGALIAASFYLLLSGGSIATERAFVMAAVALCAVMLDRRAFSLRAVALAALIVLVLRPEALLGPGFQMSFAATTALIAVFNGLRDRDWVPGPARWRGWLQPVLATVISSAVAGAATAPIAAAHFNIYAKFGLIANLASVPLMGLLVIPAGVLAVLLLPFGAAAPVLWVMGQGLGWILAVAHRVSDWSGAVVPVPGPAWQVLPLFGLGMLWIVIWAGRGRALGAVPVAAALWLWIGTDRPAVLIADSGTLVGVMTPEGRALSRSRGAGFVAGIWLENDGDRADQHRAARRWPDGTGPKAVVHRHEMPGGALIHVSGKRGLAAFTGCAPGDVVVMSVPSPPDLPCLVLDPPHLARTGAVSLDEAGGLTTALDRAGDRLWYRRAMPKPRRYAAQQIPVQ